MASFNAQRAREPDAARHGGKALIRKNQSEVYQERQNKMHNRDWWVNYLSHMRKLERINSQKQRLQKISASQMHTRESQQDGELS